MKTFIAFSFIIALTACAQSAYQDHSNVVADTQYEKWQIQILEECTRKAATITVELMEEKAKGGVFVRQTQAHMINRYILELCYRKKWDCDMIIGGVKKMFQLKPKPNKFLHPTKGWLDGIEAIKYHTEIGKRYPYEISSWVMLFTQELKDAYEENIRQNAK